MTQRSKGFTLVELLITVSLVGVLAAIAIPSFSSVIQNSRAETEVGDLQRALNFTRLEAINRGMNMTLMPTSGTSWNTELKVVLSSDVNTVIRTVGAMSSGATVSAPSVSVIEFSNLGGLITPSSSVVMTYTLGTISKTVYVCLNGRIVSSGNCDG